MKRLALATAALLSLAACSGWQDQRSSPSSSNAPPLSATSNQGTPMGPGQGGNASGAPQNQGWGQNTNVQGTALPGDSGLGGSSAASSGSGSGGGGGR